MRFSLYITTIGMFYTLGCFIYNREFITLWFSFLFFIWFLLELYNNNNKYFKGV